VPHFNRHDSPTHLERHLKTYHTPQHQAGSAQEQKRVVALVAFKRLPRGQVKVQDRASDWAVLEVIPVSPNPVLSDIEVKIFLSSCDV
jgi:hypothetical protein